MYTHAHNKLNDPSNYFFASLSCRTQQLYIYYSEARSAFPYKFYFGHCIGDRNYLNCQKVGSSVAKLSMQSSQGYIQSPLDKSHWQNFPKFIMVDYQVSQQYFTIAQINQRGSVDTDLSPWNRLQNEQAFLEVNVLIWGTLILNPFPRGV